MALVTSTVAHGKITSIDTSEALLCPGVKDFISASDVPGSNVYGFVRDEVVFADGEVSEATLFTDACFLFSHIVQSKDIIRIYQPV